MINTNSSMDGHKTPSTRHLIISPSSTARIASSSTTPIDGNKLNSKNKSLNYKAKKNLKRISESTRLPTRRRISIRPVLLSKKTKTSL
jgi:hypothetical protein